MKRIIAIAMSCGLLAACSPDAQGPAALPPIAEAAGSAPALPAQKDPMLSAVGIGVSDLEKSRAFYMDVMGMEKIRTYELSYMNEIVLGYPEAESYIVLMHWTDGSARNYKDVPVKIVTRVKDPVALAAKIKAAGFEVTREPQPSEQVGGATVGLAKDPDGYVLEILPLRQPAGAAAPAAPVSTGSNDNG